jgi:NAD(P)H-hydrate repair Nnr-like enzyme with NAD(P)H-hydrate dehydratase domain
VMLIAGTLPIKNLPLTIGKVETDEEFLVLDGHRIPCTQGTGATIGAALMTTDYLKLDTPRVLVAGDIGEGKGSREIYEYLIQRITEITPQVLVLHYCLPYMDLMRRLCESIQRCSPKPILVADAGSMYAAKAAGLAPHFEIFTPDATEIAFLADPDATHPAYIAKHLFDTDISQTPKLIAAAYRHKSAAKSLLVKGATDYVVCDGDLVATVAEPDLPALEAVGGTGDTITGLVSAFVYAGLELQEAAVIAAKANRMAGNYGRVRPDTRISEIIRQFKPVFQDHLCQWSGVCIKPEGGYDD